MADDERIAALQSEDGLEVAPGVCVRLRSLADYRQNDENPVSHTPRNLGSVIESIHKVGAARSGLSSKGKILAGNLTSEAMAEAGIEGIIEVTTDGTQWVMVNREDLTPEQEKQAAYGDQQGSFLAGWELDQVLADVEAGVDLSGLVTDFELEAILGEAWAGEETGEAPEAQIDKGAELAEKYGVKVGQIWQLGEHRLAVGDCTDKAVVDAVMRDAVPAKLFATDPPYGCDAGNIGFTAQRDDIEAITKDDLQGEEMQAFLEKVFAMWIPYLTDDCAWYLWHPMLTQGYFAAAAAADLIIHRQIIWRKEQFIFGRGDYHWRHELCFYGWRRGHRPAFYGERNQDTVWDVPWDIKRSEMGHPTAKPVMLFSIPMHNHLRRGEVAVEPFAGSGSQFVAGEQHGVKVYGCEIAPAYAAICIQRLADMGLEPKLLP